MTKYRVDTEWAGYSRGNSSYFVDANSEQEARDTYRNFDEDRETIRDDTEDEITEVVLIQP